MTIQNFDFHSSQVRVLVDEHGKEWFVAKDIAELLGYAKPENAVKAHCKAVKTCPLESGGQVRRMSIIPVPDVFRLIGRSKLPAADKFNDWVVEDVLPSIRKTGSYNAFSNVADIMANPRAAAKILVKLAEVQEEKIRLEQVNEVQQLQITALTPKADYYDKTMSSKSYFNSSVVGKSLGLSAKAFNKILHEKKYVFKQHGKWLPYAKYQNSGLFHLRTTLADRNDPESRAYSQLMFTPAGKQYFEELLTTGKKPDIEKYEPILQHHVKQLGIFEQPAELPAPTKPKVVFNAANYFEY